MQRREHDRLAAIQSRDPAVAAAQRTLLEGGRLGQEDGLRLFDAQADDIFLVKATYYLDL